MENKKNDGKYIVKDKKYGDYFYGNSSYGSDFGSAMIFDSENIPEHIRESPDREIISLSSERGLKLVVDEIHRLERYLEIEKPRLEKAEETLKKLYNFDLAQEYVKKFNDINPLIRRDDEETKRGLVERVVNPE
jgi:hypothetical protein